MTPNFVNDNVRGGSLQSNNTDLQDLTNQNHLPTNDWKHKSNMPRFRENQRLASCVNEQVALLYTYTF
jgi:hypothetical protein